MIGHKFQCQNVKRIKKIIQNECTCISTLIINKHMNCTVFFSFRLVRFNSIFAMNQRKFQNFKFNQFDFSPLILILTYSTVGAEPRGYGKEEKEDSLSLLLYVFPSHPAHHHERLNRENWGQVRFRFITRIQGGKTVKFINYDYM